MRRHHVFSFFAGMLCFASVLTACSSRRDSAYYEENRTYAGFDLVGDLDISFADTLVDLHEPKDGETAIEETIYPNVEAEETSFRMRVYQKMDLYASVGAATVNRTLADGTLIILRPIEDSIWGEVYDNGGALLGYAKDGFMHAIDSDCAAYAELPIEYGMAKTNDDTYVEAYSHLVDIRKYLRVYETTEEDYTHIDLSQYDVIVSMKLSTSDTSIGEPFYNRNLCLLQYDVLPKLMEAINLFREDGYTVIIYDAYRPTSVQQRWFDVVRVHKWVADPSRGMGGVHDRGTAIDMSLIDSEGNLVEMPTPMHTFTEASSRYADMSDTARANMDYMKEVMVSCGFSYINSEWWHFQDVNTVSYLPTDHPIDEIPLVVSEK